MTVKHHFKTVKELVEANGDPDLSCANSFLSTIPNNMGINLCSVHGLSWIKQDDGQLISLTIHFLPDP